MNELNVVGRSRNGLDAFQVVEKASDFDELVRAALRVGMSDVESDWSNSELSKIASVAGRWWGTGQPTR